MKKFQEITDFLDKHNIEYTIHLDCVEVENNLLLTNNHYLLRLLDLQCNYY